MTTHLISIILPVHNQADHLGDVLKKYAHELSKLRSPYEVILVPNGCTDQSLQICEELCQQHGNYRVIEGSLNGWGAAVKAGLLAAKGDIICYTNSARTSSRDLVLILMYALAYPDVVVKAARKSRDSWLRRLGSLIYNLECRALFDLSYWDINGTPKVFPRIFKKLIRLKQADDLIDLEFNIICRLNDYPLIDIPILSTHRHGGESTTNLRSAWRMYWGAVRLRQKLPRIPMPSDDEN